MFQSNQKQQGYLDKVTDELFRYEHPLFQWKALSADSGVDVVVELKMKEIHNDSYKFHLSPREIESRAFAWDFQRQLYNYLHDYLIEMFTRSPQIIDY